MIKLEDNPLRTPVQELRSYCENRKDVIFWNIVYIAPSKIMGILPKCNNAAYHPQKAFLTLEKI